MGRFRVLVADDHEQMRWLIANVLDPYFEVIGCVSDGRKLVEAAIALFPDVIISDVFMPRCSGPEAMKELHTGWHQVPFVFVSTDEAEASRWIEGGAKAFVAKMDIGYDLITAVHSAISGNIYLSRSARQTPALDPETARSMSIHLLTDRRRPVS